MSDPRNIRDPRKYLSSFWDWTFLNDAFNGTKIRVTDIDGAVERNGHTLIIETKLPGQEVPEGQARMFDAWVEQGITVLVVWGPTNRVQHAQRWLITDKEEADNNSVWRFVHDWFEAADSGRTPTLDVRIEVPQPLLF